MSSAPAATVTEHPDRIIALPQRAESSERSSGRRSDVPSSPTTTQFRDEPRGAYRAQSIRSIKDVNGDVDAFLRELDAKRRQLDDQIHRYIKQRDRDFKLFERDTRIKYRAAAIAVAHDAPDAESGDRRLEQEHATSTSVSAIPASRAEMRRDESGVKDRQSTREREADLLGLFTPTYLPLLHKPRRGSDQARQPDDAATPVSEPTATVGEVQQSSTATTQSSPRLVRANSDPSNEKDLPRSLRAQLMQRTSSSGSESRGLVSVLKTGVATHRQPRKKRVSLIVGDEVVAPSDSIAVVSPAEDETVTRDVFRENDSAADTTTPRPVSPSHAVVSNPTPSPRPVDPVMADDASAITNDQTAGMVTEQPIAPPQIANKDSGEANIWTKPTAATMDAAERALDADDVLHDFDLDNIIFNDDDEVEPGPVRKDRIISPLSRDPIDDVQEADDDGSDEYLSQDESAQYSTSIAIPPSSFGSARQSRGTMDRRGSGTDSKTASGRIAGMNEQDQESIDYTSPEIEQNAIFGSYRASYSFMAGSLGESYMERNSQQLRAMREKGHQRRSSTASS